MQIVALRRESPQLRANSGSFGSLIDFFFFFSRFLRASTKSARFTDATGVFVTFGDSEIGYFAFSLSLSLSLRRTECSREFSGLRAKPQSVPGLSQRLISCQFRSLAARLEKRVTRERIGFAPAWHPLELWPRSAAVSFIPWNPLSRGSNAGQVRRRNL